MQNNMNYPYQTYIPMSQNYSNNNALISQSNSSISTQPSHYNSYYNYNTIPSQQNSSKYIRTLTFNILSVVIKLNKQIYIQTINQQMNLNNNHSNLRIFHLLIIKNNSNY